MNKSCQTGHATNIIQGFAVGYESTVTAIVVIAVCFLGSVLVYGGTSPIFVAYGVAEVRVQFRDPEIRAGTKTPNYGRVVGICTAAAQKELIGPGLLAICGPMLVGLTLGPYGLGGFLAGMILTGQLPAVFMAKAGGENSIEDGLYGGKGSEAHKASVTGDVGDPLKDTAGPAINPLIKVMNMVSQIILPLVMQYNIGARASHHVKEVNPQLGWIIAGVTLVLIVWAVWQSKRETEEMRQIDEATRETPR